ncbi:sensor histidine kinase [Brevundimonas sp.]|uniref:sensor histidine kinase n=1 Tax=Brevundimonas sp. TaxID=1871086 RepID=UPI0035B09C48
MSLAFIALGFTAFGAVGLAYRCLSLARRLRDCRSEADESAGERDRLVAELTAINGVAAAARSETLAARDRADELLARAARAALEPLAAARTMSAALVAAPSGQPQQRRRLDILEESLARAHAACEDLAQLSRCGGPSPHLRRIDPLVVIDRVAARYRSGADARRIELRSPPPEPQMAVWADAERLDRVLSAVIDNAIRYNREGGVVMIEARRQSNGLAILVHDSGRGVEEGRIEALFDPFTAHPGGARRGVGLAVARRLARSMGGDVRIDSALGEGSTVTIRLKLAKPEPVEAEAAPPRPRLTLVHIDADPVGRGVVRHHCEAVEGVALHQAETLEQGQALAHDLKPDAVIVTLVTSRDAADVRRALDRDVSTRDTRVIALARLDALTARASGVCEWLDLPLEGRAFAAALMRLKPVMTEPTRVIVR